MSSFLHRLVKGSKPAGRVDSHLTYDDLSTHLWVNFQRALAHDAKPNWWEIKVSPADASALGGSTEIAEACARFIEREWKEEGRADQGQSRDTVLCRVDGSVASGRVKVEAEELDKDELVRKTIVAEAGGVSIAKGEVEQPREEVHAEYALACPWNSVCVPVTGDLLIGRNPTGDVVVYGNAYVSNDHGQLIHDASSESGWSYVDLGSTNGSSINGRPVSGKTPVRTGDRIGLGGTCYVVFQQA